MNPNQLCHYNHIEKGMIFLRIRVRGLLNLEPMGKNPCVNHPFKTYVVSWGQLLLGSGGWQDSQSFPTCTLHQQPLHLLVGRETTNPFFHPCPSSRRDVLSSSSHRGMEKPFTVTDYFLWRIQFHDLGFLLFSPWSVVCGRFIHVVVTVASSTNVVDVGFIHDLVVVGSITFWDAT